MIPLLLNPFPYARLATELWLGSVTAMVLAPYAMAAEAQRRFWEASR